MGKRNFGAIKCLLHFDYPYFNEPNDGLDDEVGIETWSKENDDIKMYGSAIPNAGSKAPVFGYRCLYAQGAILGTNNTGIWNLNSSRDYEIEMFVNPKAHGSNAGIRRLFRLWPSTESGTASILMLSLTINGNLELTSTGWDITEPFTGATVLKINTWHHIMLRVSKQKLTLFLNGAPEFSADLPENVTLPVAQVRVGYFASATFAFFLEEFVFRHAAGSKAPTAPTEPYSGILDISKVGGFGDGSDADCIITTSRTGLGKNGVISLTTGSTITVLSWSSGAFSPDVGSEVMIHVTAPRSTTNAEYPQAGLYAFAHVVSVSGSDITLNREISTENDDDFSLDSSLLSSYYVQAIVVPNFKSFTVNSGVTLTANTWSTSTGGGIIPFRCTGDCTINGSIITHGKGTTRYDYQQMTHSKLIDRFLCSQGGGIFIACGGTFTASATARLDGLLLF